MHVEVFENKIRFWPVRTLPVDGSVYKSYPHAAIECEPL